MWMIIISARLSEYAPEPMSRPHPCSNDRPHNASNHPPARSPPECPANRLRRSSSFRNHAITASILRTHLQCQRGALNRAPGNRACARNSCLHQSGKSVERLAITSHAVSRSNAAPDGALCSAGRAHDGVVRGWWSLSGSNR